MTRGLCEDPRYDAVVPGRGMVRLEGLCKAAMKRLATGKVLEIHLQDRDTLQDL